MSENTTTHENGPDPAKNDRPRGVNELPLTPEQAQRAAALGTARALLQRTTVVGPSVLSPAALIELAEYILDGTARS